MFSNKYPFQGVDVENIESVIDLCLKVDPDERPKCARLDRYLTDVYESQMEKRRVQEIVFQSLE